MTNSPTTSHPPILSLSKIQQQLQEQQLDGWLLYDFRGQNPVAMHVAGLHESGSRRWFLWIPTAGTPTWLIHAIEGSTFDSVAAEMAGPIHKYVSWQELDGKLAQIVGKADSSKASTLRIAMEYSPNCAIPYVSKVDAGIKELVENATGAEIVTSADLVQIAQAVLSDSQVESHRRAAAKCLEAKDLACSFIRESLLANKEITEYDVQSVIMDLFARHDMALSHPAIVAVNAHAADPHYAPTMTRNSPVRRGDMILMDIFTQDQTSPHDCFGDITWTAFCGEETPAAVTDVFNVVAAGRDAAVAAIVERMDVGGPIYGYEVDEACRRVIIDAGYGDYILHRTGHSLGPLVHWNGVNIDNLETQDRRSLIPGVMFTIEPGIYLPDFKVSESALGLGIRSEVNCLMHADRVEVTTLPLQTDVPALLG